jgi:hypothetical protein
VVDLVDPVRPCWWFDGPSRDAAGRSRLQGAKIDEAFESLAKPPSPAMNFRRRMLDPLTARPFLRDARSFMTWERQSPWRSVATVSLASSHNVYPCLFLVSVAKTIWDLVLGRATGELPSLLQFLVAPEFHSRGAIMPEPHQDMRTIRKVLTNNHRGELYKAELKTRWFEDPSHHGADDYTYNHYVMNDAELGRSLDLLVRNSEVSFERWAFEEQVTSAFDRLDQKLRLKDNLFTDTATKDAFDRLRDVFPDDMLAQSTTHDSLYAFDSESMKAFHELLDDAKGGAQRNATELRTELATAITLSTDEIKKQTGDDKIWQEFGSPEAA